ncbi:hypothetical protein D3272_13815 [Lichenibacterium ramalinae]|uniref:Lipid A biosynthesis N-terminal domain-containing protein n=1 Tax=Lichenibacterium ramalinae TaxID=2316527 RepID=A0A4V1RII8_9HYPH|nr:hypothetical protein D3272_13815 [Lichenibacterium ramalinae]
MASLTGSPPGSSISWASAGFSCGAGACRGSRSSKHVSFSLPHDVGVYLYDVFIGRFDLWVGFGIVAQMMFAGRFLVQWIESERAGRSVIPVSFWILSILGGGMTLVYGLVRHDAIIILGQVLSNLIYVRNLVLIAKNRRIARQGG